MTPTRANLTGANLALCLLAIDPKGLGGLHLRARACPTRERFIKISQSMFGGSTRVSPSVSDTQLFGGVDIAATLRTGKLVHGTGILSPNAALFVSMAERCEAGLAARLAQALDETRVGGLVLFDEGIDDEHIPASLADRVAFSCALPDTLMDLPGVTHCQPKHVSVPDDAIIALTVTASQLGITSLRAPLFALAAARAHAALFGRDSVDPVDLEQAAALVYAHRATQLPSDDDIADPPPQPPETPEQDTAQNGSDPEKMEQVPEDMILEAVKAFLPDGVMAALQDGRGNKQAKGSGGAGARRKGNRRGRPLPSRRGALTGQNRIDIIATLRAAAPWQTIRRQQTPDRSGLLIRPSDIHVRRYQEMSDRLIIFAVDASGSSAIARLAEAKGAVELMLAEAYARRDHVALVAFRGEGADILLEPTRSLVQTKRQLASLPGGGGTPLAAGLQRSAELATRSRAHGLSPSLALLTDGRANVPLPGRTGRAAASEDATQMARFVQSLGLPSAVIDTSKRPHRDLQTLSDTLSATYVALPRADAQTLSSAVNLALST